MVLGPGQLMTLCRAEAESRVVAGMEVLAGMNGATEPVEDLEVDIRIGLGLGLRDDRVDPYGALQRRDARIAGDAVPHRGCRVVVDRAEVALAVNQQVTQGEVLRHPHQRVVDR